MEQNQPAPGIFQYGFPNNNEANSSGISWAAVMGGAFVTAALSVILLALGAGLGLSSISPWSNVGATASTIGTAAIIWLIAMQIISSSLGGYLAGRLRTRWSSLNTNEVYFRDTAHGFLVWAVAIVITMSFLTSTAATMVGGTGQSGDTPLADGRGFDPGGYYVDALFRSENPAQDRNDAPVRAEVGSILANALRQKEIPAADKTYLTQLIVAKTGLKQADAEKRVQDVFSETREIAEVARKAVSHLLLWFFIALLIGAFSASYAATIGGRQRDNVETI